MMLKTLKRIVSDEVFLPVLILVIYLLFLFFIRGSLPPTPEIIRSLAHLYQQHGYQIIFAASVLEALLLVNMFVPGGVVIATGAVFAKSGSLELPGVILAASLGLIVGYILDYGLGYFGFSKVLIGLGYGKFLDQTKQKLITSGSKALIFGFIYSTVGSFLAMTAGIIRMNFGQFLLVSTISTLFWVTVAGISVYLLGEVFITIITKYSFLLILLLILGFLLSKITHLLKIKFKKVK